ncbi:MAG: PqqD family protein [Acidobacteriota bacterium]
MQTRYESKPFVKSVADADGMTLLDLRGGKYFSLTGVGVDIWRAIEERRNHQEIVDQLCESYQQPADRISADLDGFLAELDRKGLIDARSN